MCLSNNGFVTEMDILGITKSLIKIRSEINIYSIEAKNAKLIMEVISFKCGGL